VAKILDEELAEGAGAQRTLLLEDAWRFVLTLP